MLGRSYKILFALILCLSVLVGTAAAGPAVTDKRSGDSLDGSPGYKAVSKVKPTSAHPIKVRPYGFSSGFGGLSKFNPIGWGANCFLPGPAKGQFVLGTSFFFSRLNGEAKYGRTTAGQESSLVNFDEHLGLKKSGNMAWSIDAHYQFRPRWGFRYSFAPISMDATHTPSSSFTFGDRSFTGNSRVHSKWERYTHKAGLVFNLSRKVSNSTKFLAEWIYVQDKLTVGESGGNVTSVTWDDTKSLASLGIEFKRCLRNYKGNTLAIGCKGAIVFLDNNIGYDAEAALSYLIPIKRGRFGFLKGGYKYASLKMEKDSEVLSTALDGPYLQVGFIF